MSPSIPPGYVTVADLATKYRRTASGIRIRLAAEQVPCKRIPRISATGHKLGGHSIIIYQADAAHAALTRSRRIPSRPACAPGYLGMLARAFGLTRAEVRAALDAAGVETTPRVCPTCGKPTLYYNDRSAAHAALSAAMRRYPLPPQSTIDH